MRGQFKYRVDGSANSRTDRERKKKTKQEDDVNVDLLFH